MSNNNLQYFRANVRCLLAFDSWHGSLSPINFLPVKILSSACKCQYTLTVVTFFAGLKVTSDALIGKSNWDALFQQPNFFSKYKYMISPFFVCLNVTLSISSSGLYYKLNVPLKVDAIKIYFGSVVFYWWSVCVNNSFKYSRWKKQIQQFTCEGNVLNQILGHFP